MKSNFKGKIKRGVYGALPPALRLKIQNRAAYAQDAVSIFRYGLHAPRKWQLMFCNPAEIQKSISVPHHWINEGYSLQRTTSGSFDLFRSDDWDTNVISVYALKNFVCVSQRIDGASWENTPDYKTLIRLARTGTPVAEWKDADIIASRYRNLDALIDYVMQGGRLLPQRLLNPCFREAGGINIGVSRDGSLILVRNGTHRLAIAHHLDLEVIPIALTYVHPEAMKNGAWDKFRRRSNELAKVFYHNLNKRNRPDKNAEIPKPGHRT